MSIEEESISVEPEEQEGDEVEEREEDEEQEEELGEEDKTEGIATKGAYNSDKVNDQIFEELDLPADVVSEVQGTWTEFLRASDSREAAGEAIYAALFDSAPSLQNLFKTPRAVMAMRFMNGLSQIILSMHEPKNMKIVVETLGFQHLDLEVTPPRVVIFREAIVDLLAVEMRSRFTPKAKDGWRTILNYVGGSYIYVRSKFSVRLKILHSSWATANNKSSEGEADEEGAKEEKEGEGEEAGASGEAEGADADKQRGKDQKGGSEVQGTMEKSNNLQSGGGVPTSYADMFMFNAAVMGFKTSSWMTEVLASFEAIVLNVANSYRLQEECDVLSLRLAKYKGNINLAEYKAVMLASLRSLVPKDWNSEHEVAWSWLWENVARMLKNLMGKPAIQERALTKFIGGLDETTQSFVRREVYTKFFTIAPAGQDFFKQSTTRLHFIADKVVAMTLDMYKEPKRMVEDISALGLRHVGYGIPTDLFGAFVTGCVEVVRGLTEDDDAVDAFRWSLSLVSRMLTRVINEGSTIVMKAINANSGKQLKKAISCAPRGKRALWMLNIQVGTQSISPLLWSIETGSLESAAEIIKDLLVIRADRERYYYGMDTMFERHPDIVKRLCTDARGLVPVLFDGLIWRSRTTENGQRRVNYYIKHLVVDEEGEFSPAIEWVTENRDPKIMTHPVVALVTDIVWTKVAQMSFLVGKFWFLVSLVIFVCSQSILKADGVTENSEARRFTVAICRCLIYLISLGQLLYTHGKQIYKDLKYRSFVRLGPVVLPATLSAWQDCIGCFLTLLLVLMVILEPVLRCITQEPLFTERCVDAEPLFGVYSSLSAVALICYYVLLIDLAVFSTRISAFVLVCSRLLSEVALFFFSLSFFALAFASAVSALVQDDPNFPNLPMSILAFLKITLGMLGKDNYWDMNEYPVLLFAVIVYVVATMVFLMNLLIAQLSCAYQSTYQDMLGFARLNRGKIVWETMRNVKGKRWQRFLAALKLDQRVEFGEGDLGLAGGVQIFEPASANITTVDMIRRFGGSTSPAAQWPEEMGGNDEEDRLERMEKQIEKSIKQMSSHGGKKSRSGGGGGSSANQESGSGSHDSGGGSE